MPTITVSAPAPDRSLCSLETVKLELGIPPTDTGSDALLSGWIVSASDLVAAACRVAGDNDGDAPPTFREEVAVVTFAPDELPCRSTALLLPWRYPARVTEVAVGGEVLPADGWRAEPKGALLHRVGQGGWGRKAVAVTVRSGWPLGAVPTVLQDAVVRLVRLRWEAKGRSLMLKAETVDGVGRQEFWVGATDDGALPADILSALHDAGLVNVAIG